MPQLDPTWFASQLFWLAVCLVVLYVALSRFLLPNLMGVIDARRAARENDLSRAERLREEAKIVQRDYEQALADARLRAQTILGTAEELNDQTADKAATELNRTLATQTAEAERRIQTQQRSLIAHLEPVAGELAAVAVQKLTGLKADVSRARAIIHQNRGA